MIFETITCTDCIREDQDMAKKGKPQKRKWILSIAAQNSAIMTNYIETKIDYTKQNSKWRLCGKGDENVNHIISGCNKLAHKEYKTRHD